MPLRLINRCRAVVMMMKWSARSDHIRTPSRRCKLCSSNSSARKSNMLNNAEGNSFI